MPRDYHLLSVIETLIHIDRSCFLFINNNLSNPIFDFIMPLFHHTKYFIPLILTLWILAAFYDKPNRWKLAFLIPVAIILVDQTGLLIKKAVLRPRPFVMMDLDMINHLVKPSGQNLSFPSNHAANNAVLATVLSSIYYRYKYLFWSLAITVMFSRVYIGVHYPLDVISGCILGSLYGLTLVKVWDYFYKISSIKIENSV